MGLLPQPPAIRRRSSGLLKVGDGACEDGGRLDVGDCGGENVQDAAPNSSTTTKTLAMRAISQ